MNEIIRSICEKGQPCIDKSKQGKSINKALEIGEKSRKMKLSNSTHIVWEFSSEPKLRTYNEYLEIIQENNLNNRDHMVHYVDVKEDKPTTNVKVIKRSTMKLEGIAENQNPNEQSKNYLEKNHDKKEIENQLQLIKMKILDKEKTIGKFSNIRVL